MPRTIGLGVRREQAEKRRELASQWLDAAAQRPEIDQVDHERMTRLGYSVRDMAGLSYAVDGSGSMGRFLEERFPAVYEKYRKSPTGSAHTNITQDQYDAIVREVVPLIFKNVDTLLDKGANPNAESDFAVSAVHKVGGSTPLFIAYRGMQDTFSNTKEHHDIFTRLLEAGASTSDHTYQEMLNDLGRNTHSATMYTNLSSPEYKEQHRASASYHLGQVEKARPVIVAFLQHGANPDQNLTYMGANGYDITVPLIEFAKANKYTDIIRAVEEAKARQQAQPSLPENSGGMA